MEPLQSPSVRSSITVKRLQTYIIVLYKLASTSDRETHRAEHALALAQSRFFVFLMLDINAESIAFEKEFKVAIML